MARRERVQPTEEWAELESRLKWPEQIKYELIRPPLLLGMSVAERSRQPGASESSYRRVRRRDPCPLRGGVLPE